MRKIREVLRLTHELKLSVRQVRAATGVGKTAVNESVSRARVIGITWPIPAEIDDAELERRLFVPADKRDGHARVVPDNLKAGITKPSRYEPGINRTYQDLGDHYGFVVLPARVRKPRDKAGLPPRKWRAFLIE